MAVQSTYLPKAQMPLLDPSRAELQASSPTLSLAVLSDSEEVGGVSSILLSRSLCLALSACPRKLSLCCLFLPPVSGLKGGALSICLSTCVDSLPVHVSSRSSSSTRSSQKRFASPSGLSRLVYIQASDSRRNHRVVARGRRDEKVDFFLLPWRLWMFMYVYTFTGTCLPTKCKGYSIGISMGTCGCLSISLCLGAATSRARCLSGKICRGSSLAPCLSNSDLFV